MTTRIIRNREQLDGLVTLIASRKFPVTVTVVNGAIRTDAQNKLQRKWLNEIADELPEHTAEEWRGYCKLHHGVPIMRAENEAFHDAYDRLIRPRDYEEKLELMMIPMDMPVTRIMTTRQKNRYLNAMWNDFVQRGVQLTAPPGWLIDE